MVWDGGVVRKVPRKSEVYAMADQLNADVALTYFFAPRTADFYASDLYVVDAYVFDLEYERMYHDSGDERNYKGVTERLFEQLIGDRNRSTSRVTTTGPLHVGILPPAFMNPTLPSSMQKEDDFYSEARRFIRSEPSLTVSFDYVARSGVRSRVGSWETHSVWQGSVVKKVPDNAKMRAIREELGVDILVLAWISDGDRANTTVDFYGFDVANGKMHQGTDVLGQAKGLVASTFAQCGILR